MAPRSEHFSVQSWKLKQRWSVIEWVAKNPCFGRYVKPLVPAAFAVVSTHQPVLGPRGGYSPFLVGHRPSLCKHKSSFWIINP
jgi:hypothetical protein